VTNLLDVSVLIALFESDHAFHQRARAWLSEHMAEGWASCPITQAGFVRIISAPRYPGSVPPAQALEILAHATAHPGHEFWPCDLSLTNTFNFNPDRVLTSSQVTDTYLLALAVARGGRLVTFDQRITLAAVPAARPANLLVITGA
jgi:toxin-antitoxin system PIN domain toxin